MPLLCICYTFFETLQSIIGQCAKRLLVIRLSRWRIETYHCRSMGLGKKRSTIILLGEAPLSNSTKTSRARSWASLVSAEYSKANSLTVAISSPNVVLIRLSLRFVLTSILLSLKKTLLMVARFTNRLTGDDLELFLDLPPVHRERA
jgi:hypothetical protein